MIFLLGQILVSRTLIFIPNFQIVQTANKTIEYCGVGMIKQKFQN